MKRDSNKGIITAISASSHEVGNQVPPNASFMKSARRRAIERRV